MIYKLLNTLRSFISRDHAKRYLLAKAYGMSEKLIWKGRR